MLKDYSQIVSRMTQAPWLMLPDSLAMLLDIVNRRIAGDSLSDEEIQIRIASTRPRTQYGDDDGNGRRIERGAGIGILPIHGPIFPKANMMTEMSGATSLEQFRNDFRELLNDPSVSTIVLDVDSPGGSSALVHETAQEIREGRDSKRIVAVANPMAASAALYLATQASEVYVTPSGYIGSLGAYIVHEDISQQEAQDGRKTTLVYSGKHKIEGNEFEPLSDEARARIQAITDESYAKFVESVALGRRTTVEHVNSHYGQGRVLMPKEALMVGMVDGIQSLDDTLGALLSNSPQPPVGALARSTARLAASGVVVPTVLTPRTEVADKEHSEPGETLGEEPPPRETPSDLGEGSRIDTPPEENMDAPLLQQMASILGLDPEKATEEEVSNAATALVAEVKPLREADREAQTRKTFAETFPEEFAKMQNLEQTDQENKAQAFARNYERFTTVVGEGDDVKTERSRFGFSSRVLTKVEEAHMAISRDEMGHEHLKSILDNIANNGVVDYSERGTSIGNITEVPGSEEKNPKKAFAKLVASLKAEDNLTHEAAVLEAARRHPDMYKAYRDSTPVITGGGS